MDIVQKLMESLGINEGQAKGGLGLLLKLAKEKLASGDFAKLAEAIPGAKDIITAAPATLGGLMGAIGGLVGSLAGKAGGAASNLGSLASLAQGFKELNLDGDMIQKFTATVIAHLKEKGGSSVAGLLEKLTA